jgi:hypothetical protein
VARRAGHRGPTCIAVAQAEIAIDGDESEADFELKTPSRTGLGEEVQNDAMDNGTILLPALQDLEEAVNDFSNAAPRAAQNVLERVVYVIDGEPLAGFLAAVLPTVDIDDFFEKAGRASGLGSGHLLWPPDRTTRVALQIGALRRILTGNPNLINFAFNFTRDGSSTHFADSLRSFENQILRPLARDISRLTETRPVPPVLFDAMGTLPPSGDAKLDELLEYARKKFKDPSPQARSEATEKLWDAWERLKSLENQGNKKMSVKALLDACSSEQGFRDMLEREAAELTKIGNDFQIRHFEAGKHFVGGADHNDYLFHRLFALMHLILFRRSQSGAP